MTAPRRTLGFWVLVSGVAAVTFVLVLQKTKQALLPASQTRVLWGAELAVIAGGLVLVSGWGRGGAWGDGQRALGTIVNNFYEPRRDAFLHSGAIGGGVLGGLWWAVATWAVLLGGMRRGSMARGLVDFEVAALVGAITGGVLGAVLGLAAGHVWETRHRRRRLAQRGSHA